MIDRVRALFSRQGLPKLLFIGAVYLLGRMEGEGRFRWGEVANFTWDKAVFISTAATESARGVLGF